MRYTIPEFILPATDIIVFDIDGVINKNLAAKVASSAYVSRVLSNVPGFKRVAIEALQLWELLLGIRYDIHEFDVLVSKVRGYGISHVGIVTERSLLGVRTIFRDKDYILQRMNFVQMRKGFFSKKQERIRGVDIWETESMKPHESVLYRLTDFAKGKGIKPGRVLIIEDDPGFRFTARSLGFRTYPDETEAIPSRKTDMPARHPQIALT
ncbi:MAG: hypothetical protein HYR95_01610 [Candidatus Colwellbacteria bacterium]|nr:hypothetical protein [Candidatus Colwellbacteria bacterium]